MPDYRPGDRLADRFEVVGTLGRGGMATVYLANDLVREDKVAVKVLHDHLAHDPAMRRRLRREVVAAGLVRNEGALVAHDLHVVGDTLALSMPFHGGTTLTERVRAEGPLPAHEVRALGLRLAGALADAHRRGVLHRDVTPNNVMLGQTAGDAVLTDFGLARTQDGGTGTATSVLGTPGYAAPEIYQGQRTDPRSDLYSLGAVLWFAATGRSPYGAGNPAGILQAQLAGTLEPLATACPGLPTDLVETIETLLRKKAEARPPSAQEVSLALRAEEPAIVPLVPVTWDPEVEPLVPASNPLPTRSTALVPNELPAGHWEVVAKGRRGCDASTLSDRVGRVLGLPSGALEVTRPMKTRKKKFRLTPPTDKQTAERLAEAAQTAGYRAEVYDARPLHPLQVLVGLAPAIFIPLIWVAFPFVTLEALGAQMALFLSIAATILIPLLSAPFSRRTADSDLPLALSSDLASHVIDLENPGDERQDLDTFIDGLPVVLRDIAQEITSDDNVRGFAESLHRTFVSTPAKPKPQVRPQTTQDRPKATQDPPKERPPPPNPRTRAENLRGRALGNLDLLTRALEERGDELPVPALADLKRSATDLRGRAVELSRSAVGLEAALASTPEPEDVTWVHGRLTRLETMQRAGEPIDPAERARLEKALESAEVASSARDKLESRLTSTLAQLLEIGAIATRAHAELLAETDVPATARVLVGRLERQVASVDATRREMARQRRAHKQAN